MRRLLIQLSQPLPIRGCRVAVALCRWQTLLARLLDNVKVGAPKVYPTTAHGFECASLLLFGLQGSITIPIDRF